MKKQKFEIVKVFSTDPMPVWLRSFFNKEILGEFKDFEKYLIGDIVVSTRAGKGRYNAETVALAQKADDWLKKHGAEDNEVVIIKHWAA